MQTFVNWHFTPLHILSSDLPGNTVECRIRSHLTHFFGDLFIFIFKQLHAFVLQISLLIAKESVKITRLISILVERLLTFRNVRRESAAFEFRILFKIAGVLHIFLTDTIKDLLAHQVFLVVSAVILLEKSELLLGKLMLPKILHF